MGIKQKRKENKEMKKVLTMLVCLCMVCALVAGCAANQADQATATDAEQQEAAATAEPAAAVEEATPEPEISFPEGTIRIICPYGAGGGTDTILRALADSASKIAGVNIVVENITGGTGITGITTMMACDPDGYNLCSVSGEWISLPTLGLAPSDFNYDNCERICLFNQDPNCFVVAANSPYDTLEDLVNAALETPGGLIMATTGAGGTHHLTGLLFEDRSGTDFNIIPYSEGASAVMAALVGGHADVGCVGPAEAAAQVDAGNAKILAIASDGRIDKYPDVPTFTECGYDIIYGTWRGLAAPAGTPEEVVNKLNEIFVAAAEDEAFASFMDANGFGHKIYDREAWAEIFPDQVAIIKDVCEIYLATQ